MKTKTLIFTVFSVLAFSSCHHSPAAPDITEDKTMDVPVSLRDVAVLLSSIDMGQEQLREVHDAVSSSSGNGYDEEYTMKKLFEQPGAGVGDELLKSSPVRTYSVPLRELITEYYSSGKASLDGEGSVPEPERCLKYLMDSDLQVYWPNQDNWDGSEFPVITYDPLTGADSNVGYRPCADGSLEEVVVDEKYASEHPVWVVNNNEDAGSVSLDILKKNNPEWGAGGSLVVKSAKSDGGLKSVVLRKFVARRQYDSWFRGAAEFFIKVGAVEKFTAKIEEDLRLYNPSITDFMVVVKRCDVGKEIELNTLLISEWTDQLENCALMIIEDDGGKRTSWDCSATVKYSSKSYGFDISLPYRSNDDIVWRGQLSRNYIEANDNIMGYFGDTRLSFGIISH